MPKLIQICASQNDLFGLAGDGAVYQYNFSSNTWTQLGREWSEQAGLPRGESRSAQKTASPTPPPRR